MPGLGYRIEHQTSIGASHTHPRMKLWPNGRVMVAARYTGITPAGVRLYLYSYNDIDGFALLDTATFAPTQDVHSLGEIPVACFDSTNGFLVWHERKPGETRPWFPWATYVSISGDSISIGNSVQVDTANPRNGYNSGAGIGVSSTVGGVFYGNFSAPFNSSPKSSRITRSGSTISATSPFEFFSTSFEAWWTRLNWSVSDGRIVAIVHADTGSFDVDAWLFQDTGSNWDDIERLRIKALSGGISGQVIHNASMGLIDEDLWAVGWIQAANGSNIRYFHAKPMHKSGDDIFMGPGYNHQTNNQEYWKQTDGTDHTYRMHGWPDTGDSGFVYLNNTDLSKVMATELRFGDGTSAFTVGDEYELLDLSSQPAEIATEPKDGYTGFITWRVGSTVEFGALRRGAIATDRVPDLRMNRRSSSRASGRHDPSVQDSIRNPGGGVFI